MKKNNEKIANYLSGRMTDEENMVFETELFNNKELRKDFENIKMNLDDLKTSNQVDINETYFINLLPQVRQKIEVRKKLWLIKNLYYLVPTAAAVVVLFMFVFNAKTNYEMHYQEVAKEVVNNISDKEVSEKYLAELEVDPSSSVTEVSNSDLTIQIPFDVEANNETISKYIDNSDNDTYAALRNLPDNQLEKIYNKLKSKNSK